MASTPDYTIAAVDRALLVLEYLADHPDQGVTEIAKRLALTKTVIFRILSTLEARGFVVKSDGRSTYSLGYRVGVLGERAGAQNTLIAAARPIMERLRDDSSENVNLVVREGRQSLVMATLAGRHAMRIFANPGRYGPLHAGGGSMLLLAYAPESLREELIASPLERFTPDTATDPEELRSLLSTIRADGFNIAMNDLDLGAFSIAAPVRNDAGDVIAALSIAGAIARYDETRRRRYLGLVQTAAAEISGKLMLTTAA